VPARSCVWTMNTMLGRAQSGFLSTIKIASKEGKCGLRRSKPGSPYQPDCKLNLQSGAHNPVIVQVSTTNPLSPCCYNMRDHYKSTDARFPSGSLHLFLRRVTNTPSSHEPRANGLHRHASSGAFAQQRSAGHPKAEAPERPRSTGKLEEAAAESGSSLIEDASRQQSSKFCHSHVRLLAGDAISPAETLLGAKYTVCGLVRLML
jgi:hypothetical protein